MTAQRHPASFRDPHGFVFVRDGVLLRQIGRAHAEDHEHCERSGLYARLVADGLLLPHEDAPRELALTPDAAAVLRPRPLALVTYPYEWTHAQLQRAALATLRIATLALDHGAVLRDASAYNIQWVDGRPVLIDISSLGKRRSGAPWDAYRQFCMHFLAPLALMSYRDPRMGAMLREHLDGVPLDLAAALLPWRARLRPGLAMHLFLHARAEARGGAATSGTGAARGLSDQGLRGILGSLESTVRALRYRPRGSRWGAYERAESYPDEGLAAKRALVEEVVRELRPRVVWDVGANDGEFSRIAARHARLVLSLDSDHEAVARNVEASADVANVVPLVVDAANPSPGIGWMTRERAPFHERSEPDLLLALALVHHLALGAGIPFERLVDVLALAPHALVEFVPPEDAQAAPMLAARPDLAPGYTLKAFEDAVSPRFSVVRRDALPGSGRVLLLLRRNAA